MEILLQALRQVLFMLDQVTYGLIPAAYELIFYLANVNLFGNEILSGVINRVYLLLGIFMLFKVAFSMIQFLIDPNAFSDQSKGFAKLVTNSLVAVVLLVMTPFFFEKAYELQGDIVLSNAIPRLILGDTNYTDNLNGKSFSLDSKTTISDKALKEQQNIIHSMGVDVQFAMFSAFYNINTSDDDNGYKDCRPTPEHPISNVLGSSDMLQTCWGTVQPALTQELHKQGGTLRELFKYKANTTKAGDSCPNGICDERNFAGFGKLLWWIKAGGNSPFTINYIPIISAVAGGYLLLLLITFAIDIAVRVFKLLFLQAIAPIAIISYMDPTESISKSKFRNWLNECGKTYVSLFLRLAVIYFAILLIRIITSSIFAATGDNSMYYGNTAPGDTMNMFVYVFLILGIFTFAKKVPQMIEGIFGFKMSGELNLNPFKNEGFQMGLGAAAVGGAALGAGLVNTGVGLGRTVMGTRNVFRNSRANGEGMIESVFNAAGAATLGARNTLLSGAGGFVGGGRRAVMGALHGEKSALKNFTKSYGSAIFARQQRQDYNGQGSTWLGRARSDIDRYLGVLNPGQQQGLDYKTEETLIKREQAAHNARRDARLKPIQEYGEYLKQMSTRISQNSDVKNAQKVLDRMKASGAAQADIEAQENILKAQKKIAGQQLMSDPSTDAMRRRMDELLRQDTNLASYIKDDGSFDSSAETSTTNLAWDTTEEFKRQERELDPSGNGRTFDERLYELSTVKETPEWTANEIDNKSRAVHEPQPEGWEPSHGYGYGQSEVGSVEGNMMGRGSRFRQGPRS